MTGRRLSPEARQTVPLSEAAQALGIEQALARQLVDESRFPVAVLEGSRVPVSEVSALRRVLRHAQHPAGWRSPSSPTQER